jgi:hypothetical protein
MKTKPKFKRGCLKARGKWHDDGNAFMCEVCGEVTPRTRMNPMPELKHRPIKTNARSGR